MALLTDDPALEDEPAADTRAGPADVDVCICTFRRLFVAQTIASLAGQARDGLRLRVIVADNDETPSARDTVEQAFAASGLDGLYIHAPARNISIARNACLDAVTAPLMAFLDDDETARSGWLDALLAHRAAVNADVVFGLVSAVYAPDAPEWMAKADLHSTRAVIRNGVIDTGYAGNALIRSALVKTLRFDPALGRSGGEDTAFFAALHRAGAKLAYSEAAAADEPVPAERTSLDWLMRRSFRSGQSHGQMLLARGQNRLALIASSMAKVAYCRAVSLLSFRSEGRSRRSAIRGALHRGVIAAALGAKQQELYG